MIKVVFKSIKNFSFLHFVLLFLESIQIIFLFHFFVIFAIFHKLIKDFLQR